MLLLFDCFRSSFSPTNNKIRHSCMHMRNGSDIEKVGHLQAGPQEQEEARGPPMFSLGVGTLYKIR